MIRGALLRERSNGLGSVHLLWYSSSTIALSRERCTNGPVTATHSMAVDPTSWGRLKTIGMHEEWRPYSTSARSKGISRIDDCSSERAVPFVSAPAGLTIVTGAAESAKRDREGQDMRMILVIPPRRFRKMICTGQNDEIVPKSWIPGGRIRGRTLGQGSDRTSLRKMNRGGSSMQKRKLTN
jgi:hypothetical protein